MTNILVAQAALLAVVFVAAAGGCYFALARWLSLRASRLPDAMDRLSPPAPGDAQAVRRRLVRWLGPVARPARDGAGEGSALRIRFQNAGLRSPNAPLAYFAAKTVLTFALAGAALVTVWGSGAARGSLALLAAAALVPAALGYYLPNFVLAKLVDRRRCELSQAFPDAIDLMRVCVEAGLGIDAAIERVGREMALESRALAEELHLVSLELRAGASRADALHNLAQRVGLEDIHAMASTLVQADRFGTGIAESLRVHSYALRVKRRLAAEEAAAKLPVKLLVPLIFCIFPALLTVLLGPAAISIYRMFAGGVGHTP